jgi:phosphoribosylformylglycinamidine synthase
MRVRVTVTPRRGVLDPQRQAVAHGLRRLDFGEVRGVRVGRVIDLDLDIDDPASAERRAHAMARELLCNAVIEDFSVTVLG